MMEYFAALFDVPELIRATGYLGLFLITFTESGLLVGAFLPGDSLLFTAGFLASQDLLNIVGVMVVCFTGAVLGDSVGYQLGRRYGHRVFKKEKSLFFDKEYVSKAEVFYAKHGAATIIMARFMPIIRTLAPVLAGVGKMDYRVFVSFNVIGGLLWSVSVPLLGYFLGKSIPDIDKYLLPIILLIIGVSVAPSTIHIIRDKKMRSKLLDFVTARLPGKKNNGRP